MSFWRLIHTIDVRFYSGDCRLQVLALAEKPFSICYPGEIARVVRVDPKTQNLSDHLGNLATLFGEFGEFAYAIDRKIVRIHLEVSCGALLRLFADQLIHRTGLRVNGPIIDRQDRRRHDVRSVGLARMPCNDTTEATHAEIPIANFNHHEARRDTR